MADNIDGYVAELRVLLVGRLSQDRVDSIIKEAEGHLRESVQRKINTTLDGEAAAEAAIEAYGKPTRVALAFLRCSNLRMWGLNPTWWAGLGALVAICCWNFHWQTLGGYFDRFGDVDLNYIAGLIGLLGVVLLIKAARVGYRSRRGALAAVTVVAAALSVPLTAYWMVPSTTPSPWTFEQGISRFHLNRDLPNVQANLRHIQVYETLLERGMHEFGTLKSAGELSPEFRDPTMLAQQFGMNRLDPNIGGMTTSLGGQFVVPRAYGAFVQVDGRTDVLATTNSFEEAKKDWAAFGPVNLKTLKWNFTNFASLETNAKEAAAGRLFFFEPDLYGQTIFATLMLLPLFLLFDGIAAWSARPRRRSPRRAIA